ncbi:fatty acid synthase alpha subunit Lsd1, partial [Coemansia sp. Cherry 401B]
LSVGPAVSGQVQELVARFDPDLADDIAPIELYARFLLFCAKRDQTAALAVLESMCQEYGVPDTDIHVVVQQHSLSTASAQCVLKAYFAFWGVAAVQHCYATAGVPELLASKSTHMMAMFGGQSGTSVYVEEAAWLYDVYAPLLDGYLQRISAFLDNESQDQRLAPMYGQGFDVYGWITRPDTAPGMSYLLSSPVGIPFNALAQLMQVLVLFKAYGVAPGELAKHFACTAGHSQGIVTAAAFSAMSDEESFYTVSAKSLGLLMLVAALPQRDFPFYELVEKSEDGSTETTCYPMALVSGVTTARINELIAEFNRARDSSLEHVYLAVTNGPNANIVAGELESVAVFSRYMRTQTSSSRQSAAEVSVSYVGIAAPYHCTLLSPCTGNIYTMAVEKQWTLGSSDMHVPVRAGDDGHDIRSETDVTRYLVESCCVLPVNWPRAIAEPKCTHIVDMGTGGLAGFGKLSLKCVEGRGVPVIFAGALLPHPTNAALGTRADLFKHRLSDVVTADSWPNKHGPKLVRIVGDSNIRVDTRLSRVLGASAVMACCVLPETDADLELVAAATNAGFAVEVDCAELGTASEVADRLHALAKLVNPGLGVAVRCSYDSQQGWDTQFNEVLRLRQQGLPITGLCVGGSVPMASQAGQIIDALRTAGIQYVTFTASTVEDIRAVVQIAGACNDYPTILRWVDQSQLGEDALSPVLNIYGAIRSCSNIALAVESESADADRLLSHIIGDWSVSSGRAPMPMDGVVLHVGPRAVSQSNLADPENSKIALDLERMTYADVIRGMINLLYRSEQREWASDSARTAVFEFINRAERRLCVEYRAQSAVLTLWLANPETLAAEFAGEYPDAEMQLLASEDIQVFAEMCRRYGRGVAPLIAPLADTSNDESIAAAVELRSASGVLDDLRCNLIKLLAQRLHSNSTAAIPCVEYLGGEPAVVNCPDSILLSTSAMERVFRLPADADLLPSLDMWLQVLAGPGKSWLRALLTAPAIVQDGKHVENFVRPLLRARSDRVVTVRLESAQPQAIRIAGLAGQTELELYRVDASTVRLSIHHRLDDVSDTLDYEFSYCPATPLAPICLNTEAAVAATNRFNATVVARRPVEQLLPAGSPLWQAVIADGDFVVTEEHLRQYCQITGNRLRYYAKEIDGAVHAPMDYLAISAVAAGVFGIMASPAVSSGKQLKFVQISSEIKLDDGADLPRVGDRLRCTLSLAGVFNGPSGVVLDVAGTVCNADQPPGMLRYQILYQGHRLPHSGCFQRENRQQFAVRLGSEMDAVALEAKDWFVGREGADVPKLAAGMDLEFCLDSIYFYETDTVYSSVATTGTVCQRLWNGRLVPVGSVDYASGRAVRNPVVSYLQRQQESAAANNIVPLSNGDRRIGPAPGSSALAITAPLSNVEYARVSGDGNPIHTNPYSADIVGLPGTITHGMWTSSAVRALVEKHAIQGHAPRMRAFRSEFTGMVLPGDQLRTTLRHVGMKGGRMVVHGHTETAGGMPAMECEAEVDQPPTAYVFTGQGAQHAGMGMELYEQSPAAQAVWDRASQHMANTYGIPLLKIVRENPERLTVHFGGPAGARFLRSYLAINQTAGMAVVDVCEDSDRLAFVSPLGLLNLTQFTQLALVTNALATVADMRAHGLVQQDAVFAGHSLGEFSALAALAHAFDVECVLDIVFCRGLLMQSAIARNAQGQTGYGMVAVDPGRVNVQGDSESLLLAVVAEISERSGQLLQIVNHNVRGRQLVVSGTLANLAALRLVLDCLDSNVCVSRVVADVLSGPIDPTPARGLATVPLDNIDVPFHSRLLLNVVPAFRNVLQAKLAIGDISVKALAGRYVPNLTGTPFAATHEYAETVHHATGSPVLGDVLSNWTSSTQMADDDEAQLGLLVLTELLAYQLAMPVQWIQTQECLFGALAVERVVEVGPQPVLCGMAAKSLAGRAYVCKSVELLHVERDRDAVYYADGSVGDSAEPEDAGDKAVVEPPVNNKPDTAKSAENTPADNQPIEYKPSESTSGADTPSQPEAARSPEASQALDDAMLPTADIARVIVAAKLKKPLSSVSADKSIAMLVAGKSTLQNEIVGDLQREFGARMPTRAEETLLRELGAAIGPVDSALGKHSQPLVARMFGGKMPGGFTLSKARSALQQLYGLGPMRQDAVLLLALTAEPSVRLASEADAQAWLDKVVQAYAALAGVVLSAAANAKGLVAAGGGGAQGPTVSSAELQQVRERELKYIRQQIQVLARYAGMDLRDGARAAERGQAVTEELQAALDGVQAEFGDELVAGVQPKFDARKARRFDSYWNWARQDAYTWIQQTIAAAAAAAAATASAASATTIVNDEARVLQLQNRADPGLVQMLDGMQRVLDASSSAALASAAKLARRLHSACKAALNVPPVYRELLTPMKPVVHIEMSGQVSYSEVPRPGEPTLVEYIANLRRELGGGLPPLMHMRERDANNDWAYSKRQSDVYFDALRCIATQGISFAGKTALVTGCGRGSIGADIVSCLLMGGARVLATTSSYSRATMLFYEDIYRRHGARGSELIVVPFNQGSVQDIESLMSYVFDGASGLGWDLDFVFPFAAITDVGSTAESLGPRSELAQRVMMTNVLRMVGAVKTAKEARGYLGRPSLVMMPLSPNHGNFGSDGLYGECKSALETTFNRWESEGWADYVSVAGAVMGWARGTGLMSGNDLLAPVMEDNGVRTFSVREMAFNVLGLLHRSMCKLAEFSPVWADSTSGLGRVGLNAVTTKARLEFMARQSNQQHLAQETMLDYSDFNPGFPSKIAAFEEHLPLAQFKNRFPSATSYDQLEHLRHLQGMVNLEKVVVITGYGEVGPYGNAETRWEIEAFGELTTEGCIELAWIMGLVKHHSGPLPDSDLPYIGWVDVKSGEP